MPDYRGRIQEHGGVMKLTQAERILALLQRRRGWVNFRELNKICFRYGGRIFDLRRAGHTIEKKYERGIWWYRLAN